MLLSKTRKVGKWLPEGFTGIRIYRIRGFSGF